MKATIAIRNLSTVVSDSHLYRVATAIQIQVSRDFAPIWGADADLAFIPNDQPIPPGAWVLYVLDDADQDGALGYHEKDATDLPRGKVFARLIAQYGGSLSVTISHEVLEMLGDPYCNRLFAAGDKILAAETADACEDQRFAYEIEGVLVSDFVTPAWFDPRSAGPYDFRGYITKPLEILYGGYIGAFVAGEGWTQLTASPAPHRSAHPDFKGNRWHRRSAKT